MNTLHCTIIISLFWQFYSNSEQICPRGHRMQAIKAGLNVCVKCVEGVNYQPDNDHTYKDCLTCSKVENPDLEIEVSKCNITHNAEITCRTGYYKNKAKSLGERNTCQRCTQCQNSARICSGYNDSVCCLPNHEAVVINNEIFKCQKTQIICGAGQYLNPVTTECTSCPEGSFMPDHSHTSNKCWKCATLLNKLSFHSVIVRDCNISSPTVFGCEDGYFRDGIHVSLMAEVKCSPCQKCLREARKCDMYHNAICYNDKVTLEVSDDLESVADDKNNDEGHTSTDARFPSICHDGYYVFIDNNKSGCKNCDNATSLSDSSINHTNPHNWTCNPNVDNTLSHGEFRTYSIVLFTMAILVDILYVILYSRTFLRKISIRFPRQNSSVAEKISRVFGTVCLDLHFVLIFVHLFGTLCELNVINMSEDILWAFTVAVGTITLFIYFIDAILFIFVERVLSLKTCCPKRGRNTRRIEQTIPDDRQAMIDTTDV